MSGPHNIPDPGFRKEPKPTKRELQTQLQQAKAQASILLDHLQQVGPFADRMMKACHDVLTLSHTQRKAIDLAVLGLGPKQLVHVKHTLDKISDTVAEFAIAWKQAQNPDFVKAEFLPNAQIPVKCKTCDWEGVVSDGIEDVDGEGTIGCPKCRTVVAKVKVGGEDEEG